MIKQKIKKIISFLLNPKLLLCLGIGWFITNGWSYVMFALGTYFKIGWMIAVSGAYLTMLWIPFTPEKIITFSIAIAFLRLLFPNDERTLAVLKNSYENAKKAVKRKGKQIKEFKETKKEERKQEKQKNKL